jgi:hypothetical protein
MNVILHDVNLNIPDLSSTTESKFIERHKIEYNLLYFCIKKIFVSVFLRNKGQQSGVK